MSGWTQPRTDEMKRLWLDGKSATEIMRLLGGGVTRNAVIGKVHRLGLQRGPGAVTASLKRPKVKKAKAVKAGPPKIDRPPRAEARVAPVISLDQARPWLERTGRFQCAFLLDDNRACCASVRPGSSYCVGHHAFVYRPTTSASDLIRSLRKYA